MTGPCCSITVYKSRFIDKLENIPASSPHANAHTDHYRHYTHKNNDQLDHQETTTKMASPERIGRDPTNFWTYTPETGLIDLSRTRTTEPTPNLLTLQTTKNPIRLDTQKTALLIIDMQNFFLCPALRRKNSSSEPTPGEVAAKALLDTGIPAARAHGMRVVWLCWGLTDSDLETMPPSVMQAFGNYGSVPRERSQTVPSLPGMVHDKNPALYRGLGTELGAVELGSGEVVQGGRVLVRDSWNADLYGSLKEEYRGHAVGSGSDVKGDVLVYKNRLSGLSGQGSDLERYLEGEGITTLLFAGVNTDQCVGSTLVDASAKGYDCILVRDGAATSSPFDAALNWEWNAANCWGFVTTCEALKNGLHD